MRMFETAASSTKAPSARKKTHRLTPDLARECRERRARRRLAVLRRERLQTARLRVRHARASLADVSDRQPHLG